MNDKFFKLPLEKQQRIINAAYKVFSQNSYRKAPMSEIADERRYFESIALSLLWKQKGIIYVPVVERH